MRNGPITDIVTKAEKELSKQGFNLGYIMFDYAHIALAIERCVTARITATRIPDEEMVQCADQFLYEKLKIAGHGEIPSVDIMAQILEDVVKEALKKTSLKYATKSGPYATHSVTER